MKFLTLFAAALAGATQCLAENSTAGKKHNIVLIFTDDQDLHLGSLDHMPILQRELVAKGTQFINHYATVAQCCPSRASLFRGQAAHNTNITDVRGPGGDYQKWLVAKENEEYLPHWLVNQTGYNAEYLGKFLNGFNRGNYMHKPKGWTHTDILVDPWVYNYNKVVMSANGETPKIYHGFHQLDIIRTKALDRIDKLAADDKPFYLTIAPSAPHIQSKYDMAVPQVRHKGTSKGLKVPRGGNFNNPSQEFQDDKPSWLKTLKLMDQNETDFADQQYRARLDTLQGVDEIIEDVVNQLEKNGILETTYIIYTTDNGYHLGNHRVLAGKSLPYREDTNLPMIVRGPNVPKGRTSTLPSAHLDFPPTFLEIAGMNRSDFPAMLDGRSLLKNWHSPEDAPPMCPLGDAHEIINVEFWGGAGIEAPHNGQVDVNQLNNSSYKTLRIVGEQHSYLYSKWCTGDTELYNTSKDHHELENVINRNDTETTRLKNVLNALLMATKSCADQTCRNPWKLLQPGSVGVVVDDASKLNITCLDQALQPKYDDHFRDSFKQVGFQECKQIQLIENEGPYLPENPNLGMAFRQPTDNYQPAPLGPFDKVPDAGGFHGGNDQRHVLLKYIMGNATELTKGQLGQA